TPPYEPIGRSKCVGCGFRDRCGAEAEAHDDVARIYGVDQGLARELHERGVSTVQDLLGRFTPATLASVERPWGASFQRVGRRAERILLQARAMAGEMEIVRGRPRLPAGENFVMFDVEGMPPYLDELDKVYLWGIQVFGARPGPYQAAVAGFGADGDQRRWRGFLALARKIFAEHGDIPFVHWHHYETAKLRAYVDRHGDAGGTATRVQRNCLDLLPITRDAIVLPTPSYSLKVVEQHVGYRRTLDEYGGDWSMARYIEATEAGDEAERRAIMNEILAYNREDLEATWAVLEWLRRT
ncbi:MAG: TM0106 family RecB-like putative nuclease, partial [Dehalococcoidia bacterium]